MSFTVNYTPTRPSPHEEGVTKVWGEYATPAEAEAARDACQAHHAGRAFAWVVGNGPTPGPHPGWSIGRPDSLTPGPAPEDGAEAVVGDPGPAEPVPADQAAEDPDPAFVDRLADAVALAEDAARVPGLDAAACSILADWLEDQRLPDVAGRVRRMAVRPGDLLVIEMDDRLSPENRKNIRDSAQPVLDRLSEGGRPVELIVLDGGMTLKHFPVGG